MARQRNWAALAPATRKRYLSKGKALGQTPQQVEQYYTSGANMGAYRGHAHPPGASERQWDALKRAARKAKLDQDGDIATILESLLQKGFKPAWILDKLDEKRDSRDTFRSLISRQLRKAGIAAGWEPGRRRFHARNLRADIELFWYH